LLLGCCTVLKAELGRACALLVLNSTDAQ
jgi:hypothetical protein